MIGPAAMNDQDPVWREHQGIVDGGHTQLGVAVCLIDYKLLYRHFLAILVLQLPSDNCEMNGGRPCANYWTVFAAT